MLLTHALGMRVVADRVSGIDPRRRPRSAGRDLVQVSLLRAPGPASELITLARH